MPPSFLQTIVLRSRSRPARMSSPARYLKNLASTTDVLRGWTGPITHSEEGTDGISELPLDILIEVKFSSLFGVPIAKLTQSHPIEDPFPAPSGCNFEAVPYNKIF